MEIKSFMVANVIVTVALGPVVAPVAWHRPLDAFLPEAPHVKAQGAHAQDHEDEKRQAKDAGQTLYWCHQVVGWFPQT